ncbi:putative phosphothreonine lyase domain-containing protein [Nocardia beijingensis]|uniref:Phosphothreonine lyase domain-containing protein n=1 Tax=Nocardia beijingensis TaxID=95162 RepID=A0ABW7WEM3_9NOCA
MSPVDNVRLPTEVTDQWWIHVRAEGRRPQLGEATSGKWLVFVPIRYLNQYWQIVKEAVQDGKLGPGAKVATARPNPHQTDPTRRPIVVYTTDWRDVDDVRRVLRGLRSLGITWRLTYKTDEATTTGVYGRHAGTYVSPSGSSDIIDRITSRSKPLSR